MLGLRLPAERVRWLARLLRARRREHILEVVIEELDVRDVVRGLLRLRPRMLWLGLWARLRLLWLRRLTLTLLVVGDSSLGVLVIRAVLQDLAVEVERALRVAPVTINARLLAEHEHQLVVLTQALEADRELAQDLEVRGGLLEEHLEVLERFLEVLVVQVQVEDLLAQLEVR